MENIIVYSTQSVILLISCPDKKGIVNNISNFIFSHNGNIIRSDQHADRQSGTFFMRIEWDLEDFDIEQKHIAQAFEPIANKYGMNWHLNFAEKNLVWLSLFHN
ncbi:MAG: ACT domain-containing protein [Spirochaetota bacterium]